MLETVKYACRSNTELFMPRLVGKLAVMLGACLALSAPARADMIKNPTAVFAGLDKITGRIISFEVGIDETVQFDSLPPKPPAS